MSNNNTRLDRIEQALLPPGKVRVVGIGDFDGEHLQADIAAARATMGLDDQLIVVEYVKDWKCNETQLAA